MEKYFWVLQSKTEASKMSGADRKGEKSDDRQMRKKTKTKTRSTEISLFCFRFLLLSLRKFILRQKIRKSAAEEVNIKDKG